MARLETHGDILELVVGAFCAREVAGRRQDMMAQEERARREAEAYHAAYVRGRGMRRRGGVV